MSRVLLVNHEALSERMTGPTIRNWELAGVLAEGNEVTLAVPGQADKQDRRFAVVSYASGELERLVIAQDIVVCAGYLLDRHPAIAKAAHLVVDLYDPFPLENLHMHKAAAIDEQYRIAAYDRGVLARLTRAGDVFLCASSRQQDFWSGWLSAVGRVNPYVHEQDPSLSRLLLTVPFGISEEPPRPAPAVFRAVRPGIGKDDFLVLWGGGIWNWFDPLTLIRAAGQIHGEIPNLRVLFPAAASPSEAVLPMRMAIEARSLSDSLGLTDKVVFFGDEWVPYDQRAAMLLEADVGVSLHLQDVETRYSFRTRVLDYLWAGLPILTTEGDSMADLVAAEDLGAVVPYGAESDLASALLTLAHSPERRAACGERSRAVGRRFRWSLAAAPLVAYCRDPWQSPDREVLRAEDPGTAWDGRLEAPVEAKRLAIRGWDTLKAEGPAGFIRKGGRYLRRRGRG